MGAYDVLEPRRSWLDTTDSGFWGWEKHGAFLVMSAELELAAWDLLGTRSGPRSLNPHGSTKCKMVSFTYASWVDGRSSSSLPVPATSDRYHEHLSPRTMSELATHVGS